MPHITIKAPAKLNLHLSVGVRRPDGFHDIESLFAAVAFGDTLFLETVSPDSRPLEIQMNWLYPDGSGAPDILSQKDNIIDRAVSLFRERSGFNENLKITVKKRIPLGSGMGGGSSNAAAALLACNELAELCNIEPLSKNCLLEMGAALGSDVPFFLRRDSAAWVTGRGEQIQSVWLGEGLKNLCVIIVYPGFSSNTAESFSLLDRYRPDPACFPCQREHVLEGFNGPPKNWPFANDFLSVFTAAAEKKGGYYEAGAVYDRIIGSFYDNGADFAGLSGSGSSCFGVFSQRETAEAANQTLVKQYSFVIRSFFT